MPKTERIEVRTGEAEKELVQRAAELTGVNMSTFVVTALVDRSRAVIAEATTTYVPADVFDALWADLDAPAHPNEALTRAAQRPRRVKRP